METEIEINGKKTKITLTPEQVKSIQKHSMNIMERIKTFDDVLDYHNLSKEYFFNETCKGLSADEVAYKQLKLIVSALNEGWKPNYDNDNEYKYEPYFNLNGGFSDSGATAWCADTDCGSRLVYKSRELANYGAETFLSIYKSYIK